MDKYELHSEHLQKAMDWARVNRPQSSNYHKAAFANSVAYLTTGASGGYGGPSIREHICSHSLAGDGINTQVMAGNRPLTFQVPDGRLPLPGEWEFDKAIAFCDPICFGNLPRMALKIVVVEHCFSDDPDDLKQVKEWELQELADLKDRRKKEKLPQSDFNRLRYLESKHD